MSEKLSVTIITRDEEANLPACLASVSWADEVLVQDNGSTDRTLQIARKMGARVESVSWLGYGKTKQQAVNAATHDWVLSLDADEVITPECRVQIERVLAQPDAVGYRIRRRSFYLGKMIRHCGWNHDYPLRLFDRRHGAFDERPVHERIHLDGPEKNLSGPILHHTYPTLRSHLLKIDEYTSLQARLLFEKGKRGTPYTAMANGVWKFFSAYVLRLGFLDGLTGLILCLNSGYGVYIKYLKLWEITRNT
jgi:glycosyltransferase involved in cell wall biosynthesis